jgi:hypothetical protein
MKSKLLNCITGMTLLAGMTIPLQVAAQSQNELNKKPAHYSVRMALVTKAGCRVLPTSQGTLFSMVFFGPKRTA